MTSQTSENLVIRAASLDDLERLLEISRLVGSGMTSMPSDRQSWCDKLERSIADFDSDTPSMNGDIYFMVLEDLETGDIAGSCAVYQGIGLQKPFYSYKLATLTSSSEKLDLTVHTRVLNLVNDFSGSTEIGSLFLMPAYRRDGIGKFLSRSRFLMLADFPERFDETVFAEMRGWLDKNGESPFWNALGHKFFGLSFEKADFISAVDGFQFISDLMPKYPVYLDLLPRDAQNIVGQPHDDAAPAFNILKKEGFSYSGYVDIFDAGPTVASPAAHISTASKSALITVNSVVPELGPETEWQSHIISNNTLKGYRLTRAKVRHLEGGGLEVTEQTAQTLNIELGSVLRVVQERNPS